MANWDDEAFTESFIENDRALFDDAPCGFIFTDVSGMFLKCNKTFLRWLEVSREELVKKKRFQDVLAVGSKIYYESHLRPLLHMQGTISEITLDLAPAVGPHIPVLISSSEVKDDQGKVVLIKSTIFNISERRRYEKELLESRQRYERTAHRMHLLAVAGEELRKSTAYALHFQRILEVGVQTFCDIIAVDLLRDDRLVRTASAQSTTKSAIIIEDPSLLEKPINLATESEIKKYPQFELLEPESVMLIPMHRDGKLIGVVSFYMVQLGRKFSQEDFALARELSMRFVDAIESALLHERSERALRDLEQSHEWFSTTLRSIGDAVLAINPDKTVDYLNPVAEGLTGWSLDEARGQHMDVVFDIINIKTGKRAFNPVERVLEEKRVVGLANNTALRRRDGTSIIIEDSAAPIIDGQGHLRGVVLVFRDTTEQHEEEMMQSKLLEDLQQERDVRERFVATLTHDLRSPLTGIKLNLQILDRLELKDQSRRLTELIGRALSGLNRVDRMIQDLLDANRLRAGGQLTIERSVFDVRELTTEVLSELSQIHGDLFSFTAPTALEVYCSADGMRRIIENLCSNAVKYGAAGTPISVSIKQDDKSFVLSVHNQGNPIPQDKIAGLFEPYRRSPEAESGKQKGWGLGLTLVKGVALAHGGEVNVKSDERAGTTFEVRLPIVPLS